MKESSDRAIVIGAVLIAVGLGLLATNWLGLGDAAVAGAIAATLLVAYALTRSYGFLVPGMILAGAAVGTGVQDAGYDETGGFVAIYIGAGFLGIWVVDLLARGPSRWWPLVPGSLMVLFGVTQVTEGTAAAAYVQQLWPLGLVVAGIAILLGAGRRRAVAAPTSDTMRSVSRPQR